MIHVKKIIYVLVVGRQAAYIDIPVLCSNTTDRCGPHQPDRGAFRRSGSRRSPKKEVNFFYRGWFVIIDVKIGARHEPNWFSRTLLRRRFVGIMGQAARQSWVAIAVCVSSHSSSHVAIKQKCLPSSTRGGGKTASRDSLLSKLRRNCV